MTITCSVFWDDNPNLCIYEEIKVGSVAVNDETNNSILSEGTNKFVAPVEDGCILAGTFLASATVSRSNIISPIPLVTSESCQKIKDNFAFVVKGKVTVDEKLNILFSNNAGKSYFNEGNTREAFKFEEVEEEEDTQLGGRRVFVQF